MAKLCGVCNRLADDKDTVCPYCGAPVSGNAETENFGLNGLLDSMLGVGNPAADPPETASAPEKEILEKKPETDGSGRASEPVRGAAVSEPPADRALARTSDLAGKKIGRGPVANQEPGQSSESVNVEAVAAAIPETPVSGGFLSGSPVPEVTDKAKAPAARAPEPKRRINALEASIAEPEREIGVSRTSRLLVVVVILSVLALFTSVVMLIIMPMQKENREKAGMIEFLSGDWISDQFAFYDSTSKNFVEVLSVSPDGGFSMLYAIPDEASPGGWKTGDWTVEDRIEGRVDYSAEEQRLLLLYEEDGESYFFERFIMQKEESQMCLREFYDESGENYYDVVLYRINS